MIQVYYTAIFITICDNENHISLKIVKPSFKSQKRKRLNREILELIDAINQMKLANMCRNFYPNMKDYNCFSGHHKTFSKIDHIQKTQNKSQ